MIPINNYEKLLLNSSKFFTIQDLIIIWDENNKQKISKLVSYYVKNNKLFSIKRGLYSLIPENKLSNDDIYVIAQKIITPSYISFHTALNINGINFQFYSSIHLISKYFRKFKINNTEIIFHKATNKVLFNPIGIKQIVTKNGIFNIAGKERSIIDSIYLNKNQGFDHIDFKTIDKKIIKSLAILYNQPRIWKNILTNFNIKK